METENIVKKNDKKSLNLFFRIFLPITLVIAVVIPLWSINDLFLGLLLLVYFILILSFLHNKWGLFLFLLLRPALDFSTKEVILQMGSFDLNFASILGVCVVVFALWIFIKNYKELKKQPLFILWILFIAINIISLLFSINITSGIAEVTRLGTILSFFILGFILIRENKDFSRLIKVIILSSLIPSVIAFFQIINDTGLKDGINSRVFGTFAHPNMLAFYLCLSIVLTIFIFLNNNRKQLSSLLYGLLMLFQFILLIFTYTRGAWLVLFIFIVLIGIIHFRKFLIASFAFLLVFYLILTPFQERINSLVNLDPYGSITWRFELWRDAYQDIKKEPVIGHGSGTSSLVIAKNRGYMMGSTAPHNDYVRVALNTGFMGLASYLLLLAILLLTLLKLYRKQDKPKLKMFNLFILSFSLALFAMSAGDNVLNDTSLQWSFWALIGALIALQINSKKLITS